MIFTEIGFKSISGGAKSPGDYTVQGPVNATQQAMCFEATLQTFVPQNFFGGIMWWEWDTNPHDGGRCDRGYTPQDKAASAVIQKWYTGKSRNFPEIPTYQNLLQVYKNGALSTGWESWSWGSTIEFKNTQKVFPGETYSIYVDATEWGALALHHNDLDTTPYTAVQFVLIGSASLGDDIQIGCFDTDNNLIGWQPVGKFTANCTIPQDNWIKVVVPLSYLGADKREITSLVWMAENHAGKWWIDDIALTD